MQEKGEEGVILDIGANIGIATAYFKNKYPLTRVVAIEASPINYRQLIKNIEANRFQDIITLNKFVSNRNKQIRFNHQKLKPGGSFGEGYKLGNPSNFEQFYVDTIRISDIIKSLKNIVIKIDVEGAEYEILEDLALSKYVSEVLEITVEVTTSTQAHYEKLNKVLNIYYNLGFEPRFVAGYGIMHLRDKLKQGHLHLVLFRS